MTIDLANLPEGGEHFEGEISPEVFELQDSDILSVSPLCYSLFAQRFDSELLLTGSIAATFELTCMRSLHPFHQTISMPSVAVSIELGDDGIVDPGPQIREEILLELPTNPRCEDGDTPMKCEIDPKYLAVDKSANDGVDNAPAQEKPSPWGALDALDSQD
ncbi:MAG: uncharacterized metal-binding protein YceD (DUF177 family) [Akkermansiaceae bacterium]|jgi:uncharacterized metal-binding protein YceD (DUF177 family)